MHFTAGSLASRDNEFIRVETRPMYSLVLLLGSLGPSTVTLMHLVYTATCGGDDDTVITRLKLFPTKKKKT